MSYNTQFACYLFNTIKIINSELFLFDQDLATAYILFNSIFKNSENIKTNSSGHNRTHNNLI